MEAGRDLDKLVAEAMGWGDFWTDGTTLMGYSPAEYTMGIDAERVPVPEFSTDWAAAGQAWEWLAKNHPWQSAIPAICEIDGKPSVTLWGHGGPYEEIIGESYPHAIALAVIEHAIALAAIEAAKAR